MTRDEVIDRLAEVHTPEQVARAICHDAFDHFVNEYVDHPLEDPATVATRWRGFREGWDKGNDL